MKYETIKEIAGLDTITDATDSRKTRLRAAENLMLRPLGAIKRIPKYARLWALNNLSTYNASLGLTSGSGTCLLQMENEGRVFLVFWDAANSKTLGIAYAADTGAFSGDVTLTAGPAVVTVLKTGLAANKRWYCYRFKDAIRMGNGVDDNLIYQYARSGLRLRTAGTNSVPAAPLLDLVDVDPATSVQAVLNISIGSATVTLTANVANFYGTKGHNIKFAITPAGVSQSLSLVRTGSGTATSPYEFTLTTGTEASQSSANAIVSFLNLQSETLGVFYTTKNISDATANPALTLGMTAFASGADSALSNGFPPGETRTFAATYWDPGVNGMGYESAMGEARSITIGTSSTDINVQPRANMAGELSRFGYQRIYMRSGSEWQLVATVANSFSWHRIGANLTIYGTYSSDQKRTPPCTIFELFRGKMWASGNPGNPSRVWISKYSSLDEVVPEGTDTEYYLEIAGRPDDPGEPVISAMRALSETDMHIGTQKTITAVDGTSYARNAMARVTAGPINPACFVPWADNSIPYLGADGQLYAFRGLTNSEGQFLDPFAVGSMRSVADIDTLLRQPWRANLVPDPVNRLLWLWLPDASDVLRGFIYDYSSQGFVGPFDWPKLLCVTQIGVTDNRFIGCDEGGNLFVFDTSDAALADPFASSSAFTYQTAPYTPPAAEVGYGTVALVDGVLRKASTTRVETAFLDMGSPNVRKGFYSLEWTTIRNSRAILSITITSDLAHTVTCSYGDVYGRERHKMVFCLSGNAVNVAIEAVTAEDADFALRDLTIGYELQG